MAAILSHLYFLSDLPEGIGAFQLGLTIVMPGAEKPPMPFLFYSALSLRGRSRQRARTA
jgi:hypothetical protein